MRGADFTLSASRLDAILRRIRGISVLVVGDLFLDEYFDIAAELSDISLETGLPVRRVTGVRRYPGGAGNVAADFAALGARRVSILSCIGCDGEGFEVGRALERAGVDRSLLIAREGIPTLAYIKPMFRERGKPAREMERLDIENRRPLERAAGRMLLRRLDRAVRSADVIYVADQARDPGWVVAPAMRARLMALAARRGDKTFLVDSRYRLRCFGRMAIKPNRSEAARLIGTARPDLRRIGQWAALTSMRHGRPVYVTLGRQGCLCAAEGAWQRIATFEPPPPKDIVGAGDCFGAAVAAALAAGATPAQAGLIGNLAASLAIQQIGVTGCARPARLRERLRAFLQEARPRRMGAT